MEVTDVPDQTAELADASARSRFNQVIAITVAVVAVFMALCNVKDGNIVQGMQQAQADELDHWNQYQAKSIKQHLYQVQIEQWELEGQLGAQWLSPAACARLDAKLAEWKSEIARYDQEKQDLKRQAEDSRKQYDELNFHDDQFDLSEALLGLAITLFAVSSLLRHRALYGVGVLFAIGGFVMGLAGFCGWGIHPSLIKFLT